MALGASRLPRFGMNQDPPPQQADRPAEPSVAGDSPPAPAWSGPLVRAAWPILSTLGRIVAGAAGGDVVLLRSAAVAQVQRFEQVALNAGVSPREVSAARYTLCSAVDEAVLLTPWGQASDWNQGTLLSRFHGETWGGEKVFAIVERALQAPDRHADLIELLHTVLLLGFQGYLRVGRDGTAKADAVRDRLFRAVRTRLPAPAEPVPPTVRAGRRAREVATPIPVWTVAIACLVLLLCLFGVLRYSLQTQADAVAQTIDALVPRAATAQASVFPPQLSTQAGPQPAPVAVR